MTRVGGEPGRKVCKQAARADKGRFAWRACQKKARQVEGGRGRKFMSMRPDDPETGEAQAHKNALCAPLSYPSFLALSVAFPHPLFLTLLPSITSLSWRRWRITAL